MSSANGAVSTWRRTPNRPADWFSADELDRARRYQRPLTRVRIVRALLSLAVVLVFVFGEVGLSLIDALDVSGWVLQLLVVLIALQLATLVFDVPLDAWVDLVHDRRWDLSTQTAKGLAADHLKTFVLGLVMGLLLLVPLYALIRYTEWWWLFGWAIFVSFSIGLGFLFPIVIAPIFNKFTPLPEGELADRIGMVADRAGVSISGAYVADESRRSRRDNAYVAGLGRTRRVVLFDTLLEHPVEVVEQVVAHEIGHWRLRHLSRQIPLAAILTLVVFVGLNVVSEWDWLLDQAGFDPDQGFGDPASLPVLMLAVQVGFLVTGVITAWVSRAFERQADLEALRLLERPDRLMEMHRAIHVKNLADLDPGPLKRIQATHPAAAERLAFAQAWKGVSVRQ